MCVYIYMTEKEKTEWTENHTEAAISLIQILLPFYYIIQELNWNAEGICISILNGAQPW